MWLILYNNRVQEFTSTGTYIKQWGSSGKENGQFKSPQAIVVAPSGDLYVTGNEDRIQEFSAAGEYIAKWGSEGKGYGQFSDPAGIAVAANGNVYVAEINNDRIQEFSTAGEYLGQFGAEGSGNEQFHAPGGVALAGSTKIYVADADNDRIQEFTPTTLELASPSAHDTQTNYYSAAANALVPMRATSRMGEPALSKPARPFSRNGPELPVVTDTYNIWDEPETVTEKFESTTRTKKMTYDSAGRLLTNEEKASPVTDTALPKVTDKYAAETGAMVEQSTTSGETTKKIKSMYNTLASSLNTPMPPATRRSTPIQVR